MESIAKAPQKDNYKDNSGEKTSSPGGGGNEKISSVESLQEMTRIGSHDPFGGHGLPKVLREKVITGKPD